MPTPFVRTLRSLDVDRFRSTSVGLLLCGVLLAGWGAWCVLARVTLYEVSPAARIEVDRAVYPVQAPVAGRVVRSALAVGVQVRAGDTLVELDASPERLQVAELRTRLTSLGPEMDALRRQTDAEQAARAGEQTATRTGVEEARANASQAEAPAKYTAAELERLSSLHAEGLLSDREYQKAKADAEQSRFVAQRDGIAVRRLEEERQTRESDRDSRLRRLQADIANLEGQAATARAAIARLENEIDRRLIRAPVGGTLGQVAILRPGAVLEAREKVGDIVPEGNMRVVAQFPPPAALGRVAPGQRAEVRLDGFPWMQWGTVPAVVSRVASEVRDGAVRVELGIDASHATRIPLQHGLPGTVEIAVERVSPASLVLRTAGRLLASPRSAYGSGQ
jgi:multidrug resistance efflux pump